MAERARYNRDVRSRKYRVVTTLERASNRLIRLALRAGCAPRAFALLVATHGMQADYVRNLQAEPRVRVKVGGVARRSAG